MAIGCCTLAEDQQVLPGGERQPLLELHEVVKTYPTAQGDFMALKGISADFYAGEFVGILGKSGAGKTTLINMITGVDRITSGEVLAMGVSMHALGEDQAARWRGKNMGIVFQTFRLMPTLSLVNNVRLPVDFCGAYQPRASFARALALLESMEMSEHALKLPSQISGGQQQRVAIARALANDPPIIVADEPTGRLDSATSAIIMRIFERLAREGKLVLMATHDFSIAQYFSRRLEIADGVLVADSGRVGG
ncbi:MAG: ABC transporter ATP-binding protein [Anaerolineae bacterium]|nr:ABC transporter ATP-binding protein [Anaerolineae bacterium]